MHTACILLLITTLFVFHPLPTFGETIRWNGGSGYFNDASMWTPSQIPGPNDDVYITANGAYNIILQSEVTTTLGNLTIGGRQECACRDGCAMQFFVQSDLEVTNNINLLNFGVLVIVGTKVTTPYFYSERGALYGYGIISAETRFNGGAISPGLVPQLDDPSTEFVLFDPVVSQLQFIGNVNVTTETYFFMHINGSGPDLQTDKVIVNGTLDGRYTSVTFMYTYPNEIQYNTSYSVFIADDITIGKWQVEGYAMEEGEPDFIAAALCERTSSFPCDGCPMTGFSILLVEDATTCCNPTSLPNCPGEPDCNSHGTCMANPDPNGLPVCNCDQGWVGNACDIPDCSTSGNCNNRGTCNAGLCECEANWGGVGCTDPICTSKCLEHGVCKSVDSLVACECLPGYEGPECDQLIPAGQCYDDCNGHGSCDCTNGTCSCTCTANFYGPSCKYSKCQTSCGNGQCVVNANVTSCQCNAGWSGNNCSIVVCPSSCSGNGQCVSYGGVPQCDCDVSWTGSDCSMTEEISNGDGNKSRSKTVPIAVGVSVGVAFALIIGAIIAGVVILNKKKAQRRRARDNIMKSNIVASQT